MDSVVSQNRRSLLSSLRFFAKPISKVTLGAFVTKPFSGWRKFPKAARRHQERQYHQSALEVSARLEMVLKRKCDSVELQLNKRHKATMEVARKGLILIAEAIIICGTNGLALRGHEDNLVVDPNTEFFTDRSLKLGNFNTLLLYAGSKGDESLKTHFRYSPANAKFVTAQCQNELICLAEKQIQQVERVRKAKFFAILADGTSDIHKQGQFAWFFGIVLMGVFTRTSSST